MRIQHNIMAMSAYRNYTNNVSAMKKNLEKLSSGYKINRAGDDAAGLAISEKMRAQITGLQTAQKNAKDGISLVQTAEGALQEVHDMLNRMVELATQSANGTYEGDTDRAQLQKEIEQLKSEINRIADSANFNGQKLLNGELNAVAATSTVKDPTFSKLVSFEDTDYENRLAQGHPRYHEDARGDGKTQFSVGFGARTLTADADGKLTLSVGLGQKDSIGGSMVTAAFKTIELTTADGLEANKTYEAEDIAKFVYDKFGDANHKINLELVVGTIDPDDLTATKSVNIEYEMSLDGENVVFTMTDAGQKAAAEIVNNGGLKEAAGTTASAAGNTSPFQGNFTFNFYPPDQFGQKHGTYSGSNEIASKVITTGAPSAGVVLAETTVAAVAGTIKDGAGIQVGNESYVWAATDATLNGQYGDNVKVIDIRDLVKADGTLETDKLTNGLTATQEALSRLTVAAKDNDMFTVQYARGDTDVYFTERKDYNGNGKDGRADLTTLAGIKEQIKKFDGITSNVETTEAKGKSLMLQIGDTAESFNQLKVNIEDCHAASIGVGDIDISTQEGAASAIDAIKAAINKVSDVRGTLGATQNRLDHTINNLSVMTENIQDAESTIRDVDIAEEMMAYTKNNILIQSAQAMLAQANQVPQGVLQLLQ